MKIRRDYFYFYFLSLRDLAVFKKTRHFFYNFPFAIFLEKTGYFNPGRVYLWYKNTNQY